MAAKKRASKRKNPAPTYREAHGGLEGAWESKRVRVPDPSAGKLIVMGRIKRIEYETDKGEGQSLYFHDFGREVVGGEERGRVSAERKPWLVYNATGLVIAGGTYEVRAEGIVG